MFWPWFSLIGCLILFEMSGDSLSILKVYLLADIDSQTSGVIVESKVESKSYRSGKVHDISYLYNVGGYSYTSNVVNYKHRFKNPAEVQKRYPVGQKVTVYYDSSNPNYAILEKTDLGTRFYFELFGAIIIFILVWFFERDDKKVIRNTMLKIKKNNRIKKY